MRTLLLVTCSFLATACASQPTAISTVSVPPNRGTIAATAVPPSHRANLATRAAPTSGCLTGNINASAQDCQTAPTPSPTSVCPDGSIPAVGGCKQDTPQPTLTPYPSLTPRPTQDLRECFHLDLPLQYWLLEKSKIESYFNDLEGRCLIVAFDGKVIQDPITFSGKVAAFAGPNPVRLVLDAPPSQYSIVWGILRGPSSGASTYVIRVLQTRPLPKSQAPFTDGSYTVNEKSGIVPGPWKTAATIGDPSDGCHWEQDTSSGRLFNNHFGSKATHVKLSSGNTFQTTGCGSWLRVGFSVTGEPVTFISAARADDPCHNRYDIDGTCHTNERTWNACLLAGKCYEKYK